MKKKVLILLTAFALTCLIGCGNSEQAPAAGSNQESSAVDPTKEPEVTTESSSEPEPTEEPTPEATEESTPEPTEESVLYEGIDMESTLPGIEWMKTFIGVIDEPKVLAYSDETGRKEFVEEDVVLINPDVDIIAVYIPEGYKTANNIMGIKEKEVLVSEYSESYILDPEKTREHKFEMAAFYFEHDGEEIAINFVIQSE